MLLTTEFPLCDARHFTSSGGGRLPVPPWPCPEPGTHFVRCFGPVRRRRRGGHDFWADEVFFASADGAVRYQELDSRSLGSCLRPRGAYRRLLSSGLAVVRLEMGLSHYNRVAGLSRGNVLAILRDYLDLPVCVRSYRGDATTCTLAAVGKYAARLYEEATREARDETAETLSRNLVTPGRPVVLVEYEDCEVSDLPYRVSTSDPNQLGGVQLSFLWFEHRGSEVGVWFLCREGIDPKVVRRLRLGLLRLHAEHQVLKEVLLRLARGSLEYQPRTPEADQLDDYLNKATRLLSWDSRGGISLQGIRTDLLAYDEVGEPAERKLLLEKLKHVRRQIRKKVETHLDVGQACQDARREAKAARLDLEPRPQPPLAAYRGRDAYVFVSYAHADAQLVYPEIASLAQHGYRVWYDEGIDPGSTWPKRLAEAIDGCACFLVFITPRAVASRHCRDEIHFALERGKLFVAIHLEDTALPNELALQMNRHQAILQRSLAPGYWLALLQRALPPSARVDNRALIRNTLIELLEGDTGEKYPDLDDSVNLREGLNIDSVDVVSIVSQIERRLHIRLTHQELEKLVTVSDVLDLLETKVPAIR